MEAGKSIEITIEATATEFGTYQKILLIDFETTSMEIPLTIFLGEKEDNFESPLNSNFQKLLNKNFTSDDNRKYNLIPGQKMTKNPRFVDKRLGEYPVPSYLREIVLARMSLLKMEEEIKSQRSWAFEPLSGKNYYGKMRLMVHLEELACELAFK